MGLITVKFHACKGHISTVFCFFRFMSCFKTCYGERMVYDSGQKLTDRHEAFPYLKFKLGLLGKTWNPHHQTKWDLFIINTGLHTVTHELRSGRMIRSGFDHNFLGQSKSWEFRWTVLQLLVKSYILNFKVSAICVSITADRFLMSCQYDISTVYIYKKNNIKKHTDAIQLPMNLHRKIMEDEMDKISCFILSIWFNEPLSKISVSKHWLYFSSNCCQITFY